MDLYILKTTCDLFPRGPLITERFIKDPNLVLPVLTLVLHQLTNSPPLLELQQVLIVSCLVPSVPGRKPLEVRTLLNPLLLVSAVKSCLAHPPTPPRHAEVQAWEGRAFGSFWSVCWYSAYHHSK